MNYRQLNAEERSALAALRTVGLSQAAIAGELGRHRSTVWRELKRNAAPHDGWYRAGRAEERAVARRKRSRRNRQFGREEMARVVFICAMSARSLVVSGDAHEAGDEVGALRFVVGAFGVECLGLVAEFGDAVAVGVGDADEEGHEGADGIEMADDGGEVGGCECGGDAVFGVMVVGRLGNADAGTFPSYVYSEPIS